MVLISKFLVPRGYTGVTIYPFVFLKHYKLKTYNVLVNHEYIHLKQQLELLVIPFYMFYGFEFIIRLIQYRHWKTAYRNISFEREAYINEDNLGYIKNRNIWQFLKYLRSYDF